MNRLLERGTPALVMAAMAVAAPLGEGSLWENVYLLMAAICGMAPAAWTVSDAVNRYAGHSSTADAEPRSKPRGWVATDLLVSSAAGVLAAPAGALLTGFLQLLAQTMGANMLDHPSWGNTLASFTCGIVATSVIATEGRRRVRRELLESARSGLRMVQGSMLAAGGAVFLITVYIIVAGDKSNVGWVTLAMVLFAGLACYGWSRRKP